MADILRLKRIVDIEYSDITIDSNIYHGKLRVFLKDSSIADIWFSSKIPGRFSYHWERRHINGKMYRHDNFPDPCWKGVSTYPKHFHNGSQNNIEESRINDDPASGIREFMDFIKKMIG
ncbi:MAG: DUF6516 family protein [Candidatus Methanoperedens sp.]|nr:DUF6516 family protein [Candidatus Methanoperedens sp.]